MENRSGIGMTGNLRLLAFAFALLSGVAQAQAQDALQVVVSIDEQRLTVWRDGNVQAEAPVSTGKTGHETPTGIFSILGKSKFHRSNIYSNAPMPFMQRLTWDGIALHEGKLPGYPASHGCVRLPTGFAEELFAMTRRGSHVVISGPMVRPELVESAALPQPRPRAYSPSRDHWVLAHEYGRRYASNPARLVSTAGLLKPVAGKLGLGERQGPPLRILFTRRDIRHQTADIQRMLARMGHEPGEIDGLIGRSTSAAITRFQNANGLPATGSLTPDVRRAIWSAAGESEPPAGRVYVRQGFEPVYEAAIHIDEPARPLGTHLLTTSGFDAASGSTGWVAVTLEHRTTKLENALFGIAGHESDDGVVNALARISIPPDVMERLSAMLTEGSSIAISDTGLGHTGWNTDFLIPTRR